MGDKQPAVLWLRQDLRLEDNPALEAASKHPLLALYIWDEEDPGTPGGAARWWLGRSLSSLKSSFEEHGVQLVFKRGRPLEIIKELIDETKACAIYWNRCYEPHAVKRDREIKRRLRDMGIICESFKASLLAEPWELQTKSEKPYQVFTPFWKAFQSLTFPKPLPTPNMCGYKPVVSKNDIQTWGLDPTLWGSGFQDTWRPGEAGAWEKMNGFLGGKIEKYAAQRDYPSSNFTSRLSPHLHWGEISPGQIWHVVNPLYGKDASPFLRQLAWREFSYHLLFHFPELPSEPLRPSFKHFPWESNSEALKAWQKGKTGYPIVDAGMRELWHTGWMHNRVRLIVASFLVKDLLISWQKGEEWFWDTLVDADLANNAASWQWMAGCGADAAPFFRIFNPVLQSQKFDPQGVYIKKWVPELVSLGASHIHAPWEAPPEILRQAGVKLGENYPPPIIDHSFARQRALDAFRLLSVR
jgi:deoxyribodipyrimidine photo-lyase